VSPDRPSSCSFVTSLPLGRTLEIGWQTIARISGMGGLTSFGNERIQVSPCRCQRVVPGAERSTPWVSDSTSNAAVSRLPGCASEAACYRTELPAVRPPWVARRIAHGFAELVGRVLGIKREVGREPERRSGAVRYPGSRLPRLAPTLHRRRRIPGILSFRRSQSAHPEIGNGRHPIQGPSQRSSWTEACSSKAGPATPRSIEPPGVRSPAQITRPSPEISWALLELRAYFMYNMETTIVSRLRPVPPGLSVSNGFSASCIAVALVGGIFRCDFPR